MPDPLTTPLTGPNATRLPGWLGLIGPLVYVATWAVAGATRDGYSPLRDAISQLAEVGASTSIPMNAAFVIFGLTALPFAPAVTRTLPGAGPALTWAIVVAGLGTIGAAVFPCTTGCPGPGASLTDTGHTVTATIGYAALALAPLLAGRAVRHQPGWGGYATASIVIGVVASVGLVAWAANAGGATHSGLLQRTFNTLLDAWWAGTAVVVLRRQRQSR